jgi:hypothetical protein
MSKNYNDEEGNTNDETSNFRVWSRETGNMLNLATNKN